MGNGPAELPAGAGIEIGAEAGQDIVIEAGKQTAKVSLAERVYNNIVGVALANSAEQSLGDLDISPTLKNIAFAVATGGVTDPNNFFGGAMKNLAMQGVNMAAMNLALPPPAMIALNTIGRLSVDNLFNENAKSIFDNFSQVIPDTLKGNLSYLGTSGLGLPPMVSSFLAEPIGNALTSIGKDIWNGVKSTETFQSIRRELFPTPEEKHADFYNEVYNYLIQRDIEESRAISIIRSLKKVSNDPLKLAKIFSKVNTDNETAAFDLVANLSNEVIKESVKSRSDTKAKDWALKSKLIADTIQNSGKEKSMFELFIDGLIMFNEEQKKENAKL